MNGAENFEQAMSFRQEVSVGLSDSSDAAWPWKEDGVDGQIAVRLASSYRVVSDF